MIPKQPELEKGRYRHYKGNEYDVLGVAFHTESLEPLVVYTSVADKPGPDFWVRPYAMFMETVEIDGVAIQRFQKL